MEGQRGYKSGKDEESCVRSGEWCLSIGCSGWPEPYIYTVYDHKFGGFPAKNTVCTPYVYISFWLTLVIAGYTNDLEDLQRSCILKTRALDRNCVWYIG